MSETNIEALKGLREPFPAHQINKLPKPTISNDEWKKLPKGQCKECGGYHATTKTIHLDFVGHAALTDRLLDVDPCWTWEPFAIGPDGNPVIDKDGGMWIRLTVCGVTRMGYGDAQGKTGGNAMKERIGDAIRNAAMRFGAALELWHKGDLHLEEEDDAHKEPPTTKDQLRDQAANEYAAELCAQIDLCTTMEKLVAWRKDNAKQVNGLAPIHKQKVSNYWMEIEKILKEQAHE